MNRLARVMALLSLLSLMGLPQKVSAQVAQQSAKTVISANPFGLLLEFFNAEFERVIQPAVTVGIGGSTVVLDDQDYRNLDAFARLYLNGHALTGWALGGKLGLTQIPGSGTYAGLGVDVNWSTLTGPDQRLYLGLGFGLKRLLGTDEAFLTPEVVPTLRIINIGWVF